MAPRTPITTQVSLRLVDLREDVLRIVSRDGVIDPDEQAVINDIDETQGTVEWWDQWRKEAVYQLDHGVIGEFPPSYHHRRMRDELTELYPDNEPEAA